MPDGRKVIIDAAGKIISDSNPEPLEGYTYDEQTGRYVNETTGIWYVVENGQKVIPPEEYFEPDEVGIPSGRFLTHVMKNARQLKVTD